MEDALVLAAQLRDNDDAAFGLNPCFNGRCTSTAKLQ